MQRAEGGCQRCCLAVGLSCEGAELQLTAQELPVLTQFQIKMVGSCYRLPLKIKR